MRRDAVIGRTTAETRLQGSIFRFQQRQLLQSHMSVGVVVRQSTMIRIRPYDSRTLPGLLPIL